MSSTTNQRHFKVATYRKPVTCHLLINLLLLICLVVTLNSYKQQVLGFHLSFSHRLLKSAQNPQLNPASTLIRPIECRNANNQSEVGICMFSIDCMQNKGTPLSVCKHNYFVGTCCRLPDYNNFVGIVYDLRDTEGQLEVRRIPLDKIRSTAPDEPLTSVASTPVSVSTQTATTGNQHLSTSSTADDLLTASSRADYEQQLPAAATTTTTTTTISSSTTSALGAANSVNEEQHFKDKYIVSSTSLFPTTTTTGALNEQQLVSGSASAELQVARVGETARNADGVIPLPLATQQAAVAALNNSNKLHQSIVMASGEQDSFQIHSDNAAQSNNRLSSSAPGDSSMTPPATFVVQVSTSGHPVQQQVSSDEMAVTKQQQSTYELIRDESLDILATVNSVHSAPTTTQQQFQNSISVDHSEVSHIKKVPQVLVVADSSSSSSSSSNAYESELKVSTPVQQSSVYLLDEQQSQSQSQHKHNNIVFANNHQLPSSSSSTQRPPDTQTPQTSGLNLKLATQSQQVASSDQEFTLSSAPPAPTSTAANEQSHSTTTTSTTTTETRSSRPTSGSSVAPEVLHINLPGSSSSPFVDLVSNSNPTQSTTPFTTSLSTALLPNISSHPYAPTAAPNSPVLTGISSLVSNQQQQQQLGTSSRPQEASSFGFSQLYSSQHGSQQEVGISSQAPQSTSYLSRPNTNHMPNGSSGNAGLQVASKIVTSTGSLPQNNNNLIPGLSGLQSAILSHIPFKIASGLSSGLSSYLQAAMKPTGSRPLLSSNTAPSLQYQQQLAANASKLQQQQQQQQTSSAVRFPAQTGNGAAISIAASSPDEQVANSSSLAAAAAANAAASATGGSTSAEILHDIVKEAQLVCGRSQVTGSQSGGEISKKRVARIVGGNQSLFGQWPWMVSLRQWRKGAFLHKCGAALLNENWAITAAHCVENVKVTDLLLRLGEFDVSNQNEPYPYVERRVKSVVSHPSFDPKTFEYDLALLRFAEPIKYERNIVPVCVPSGNDTYVDRMATVIGWGRLYEDGPLPDVIQHVDVPIITNNECEKMYKNAGYIEEIPDMFICAGISKGGRDSCEGDSGGPLTMIDYDGRSYLVGIISWGIGCALPSQPGVYTRITAFSGWINQITAF